jgi:hypothetical protein
MFFRHVALRTALIFEKKLVNKFLVKSLMMYIVIERIA